MDPIETPIFTELSLGEEVTKSLVVSAAAAAGTLGGFIVIGLAYSAVTEFIKARKAKKASRKEAE